MKYYIYGAGKNAQTVVRQMKNYVEIAGIIDNDNKKWGQKIEGIKISAAKDLIDDFFDIEDCKIILSVTNPDVKGQIETDLQNEGLKKNIDYFEAEKICLFEGAPTPGLVSGVINVPKGFKARKSFDPASYLVKDEKNKIYRVVSPNYTEKYWRVYEACKEHGLFGKYIVDTRIADEMTQFGSKLVLEHEYINPVSYCFEWPPHMYEDYVMFMLDFIKMLSKAGLALEDAHGLNATLHHGHFTFMDLGAIDEGYTKGVKIQEILNGLVLPLILMRLDQMKRAYFYLSDNSILLGISDVAGYLDDKELDNLKALYEATIYINEKTDVFFAIDKVIEFVTNFRININIGDWEDYQDSEWDKSNDKKRWSIKMNNAIELIEEANPNSIIDLAGNQGWYSTYLREKLEKVIVTDMDTAALDKLWRRVNIDNMNNVTPVYMSICAPSLGRHYDGFIDGRTIGTIRKSGSERYKSDMAIALAIVHHLAFREHLTFEEIIKLLLSYTNNYLLVEFVEQTDKFINDFVKEGYEWYTKDAFEAKLQEYFEIINKKESSPSETRTLYLCQRR